MVYAYIHCKPDGTPFYVGKGRLRRAKYLGDRNPHHAATVRKYGANTILIGVLECSTESVAYELEVGLIKCLRRRGVCLTNFTAGGEGGNNPTPDTRLRLSVAAKKRGVSAACHEAKVRAKRGVPLTDAHKAKLSQVAKGRVFTQQHKENIRMAAVQRGVPPAVQLAAKMANKGRVQSAQERALRGVSVSKALRERGRVKAVCVDGVLFPTMKSAAEQIGVCSAAVLYALRHSGVVKGRKVEVHHGV